MFAWQATVQDDAGNAVPFPVVTVWLEDGVTLASIFDKSGVGPSAVYTPLPNPMTGTMEGFVQFWAGNGNYKIEGADGSSASEIWEVSLDNNISFTSFDDMASRQNEVLNIPIGRTIFAGGVEYIRVASGVISSVEGIAYANGFNSLSMEAPTSTIGALAASRGTPEAALALGDNPRRVSVSGASRSYAINSADFFPAYHQVLPTGSNTILIDVSGINLDREYVIVNNGGNNAIVLVDCGASAFFRAPWVSWAVTSTRRFILSSQETVRLRRILTNQILVERIASQLRWTSSNSAYFEKQTNGLWRYSYVSASDISASTEVVLSLLAKWSLTGAYLESITVLPRADGQPYTGVAPQVTKLGVGNGLANNQFALLNTNTTTWEHPVRVTFSNVLEVI